MPRSYPDKWQQLYTEAQYMLTRIDISLSECRDFDTLNALREVHIALINLLTVCKSKGNDLTT